ncbi:MAG: ribonuclease J [Ruminococcaceae bacterium]|nr:ribonuclease J [Oscillospiraceae bacterium]
MQKKNSHRAKAAQKASEQQVKIDLAEFETVKKSAKSEAAKKAAKVEVGNAGNRKAQPHTEKPVQNKRKPTNTQKKEKAVPSVRFDENAKVRIIPLGGLNEIGKNMTAIECGDDIIVIDCGLAFPDEETPGVDLIIPDVTYLEANASRVRGIVLTHGHEDHIGAIPYVLRNINPVIYGTKLTVGIVRNKLKEFSLDVVPKLVEVKAGDTIALGGMTVEFIHVNHSIADACALAIRTPLGTIVHSGDFKLDLTPIDGEIMDITRLGEVGKEGVLLLMCESTNAERPGSTPSERKVGSSLEYIFATHKRERIVIATFSSNVHRVQQIIDAAARHGRKVAVTGRSMLNIVGAAVELGYMHVPKGVLIDISEIKKYTPEQLTIVTTGSQGEPMSALYRMAFGEHREVQLCVNDVVVISSSAIPGNEKLVGRIINELCKIGVEVIHDASVEVHVSGHACQEELKLLQALIKPKYFMPVHGEYKHLAANRDLAISMGIDPRNIFISDIGNVLEIDKNGARISGTVNAGRVLVDGYGVGDVGNIVLRDRLLLSQDGLIVVVATVSSDGGYLLSGPDIVSRGFVYVKESEDLMEEMRKIVLDTVHSCLSSGRRSDWYQIKGRIKDDLAKFIYTTTKRKPMIIPMIMNV